MVLVPTNWSVSDPPSWVQCNFVYHERATAASEHWQSHNAQMKTDQTKMKPTTRNDNECAARAQYKFNFLISAKSYTLCNVCPATGSAWNTANAKHFIQLAIFPLAFLCIELNLLPFIRMGAADAAAAIRSVRGHSEMITSAGIIIITALHTIAVIVISIYFSLIVVGISSAQPGPFSHFAFRCSPMGNRQLLV